MDFSLAHFGNMSPGELGRSPSIDTDVRAPQFSKARFPILDTLSGIVTDVKLRQLQNAIDAMLLTVDGIVTDLSETQSLIACRPMSVPLEAGRCLEVV